MSRPKVLFLPSWYPNERNPIEGTFVREHAKAASLYADVVVLFPFNISWQAFLAGKRKALIGLEDNVEGGVRTIRVKFVAVPLVNRIPIVGGVLWLLFYLAATFYGFLKLRCWFNPDIIHAHVAYPAGFAGVLLGRLYRLPVVITEHSSAFPRRHLSKLEEMTARFAFRLADFVLPVSEALKQGIESYGIKARFKVVPNAVDTSLFRPDLVRRNPSGSPKRILFVGSLVPTKGLRYLFQALSQLAQRRDDFHLDIVGEGTHRQEYERLAHELSLTDKVTFQGLKSKLEVANFMRRADFLVLPSVWENMPCVLIEALASGLPIIASATGGIPEIVEDSNGVLVPVGDVRALAGAVNRMLDHAHVYNRIAIADQARQLYSYAVVGKSLDSIYRCLL